MKIPFFSKWGCQMLSKTKIAYSMIKSTASRVFWEVFIRFLKWISIFTSQNAVQEKPILDRHASSTKSMHIALNLTHLWIVYPGKERYDLDKRSSALPIRDIPVLANELKTPWWISDPPTRWKIILPTQKPKCEISSHADESLACKKRTFENYMATFS